MSSTTITTTPSRKRKAFRKLTYGKRARSNPMQRQVVNIGSGPVAQKSIVTLRYVMVYLNDGVTFDRRFNLNSLFSPEYSGGTQPLGRDQYATFYNRYRVLKCRVKIILAGNTGSTETTKIVLVPDNSTAQYSDASLAQSQKNSSVHGVENNTAVITRTFYPNVINGNTMAQYKTDDRFQALMSAKPTENIMLHVINSTVDNVCKTASYLRFTVQLDYTAELFDPIPLAAS